MNPLEFPSNYDQILLSQQLSPGIAIISGASNPRKLDIRDGMGLSGATVVLVGNALAKFNVKLRLWELKHFQDWDVWKKLLEPSPIARIMASKMARSIYHPLLAELNIKSAIVEEVSQLTQAEDDEIWEVDIKFVEYRKVRPMVAVAEGALDTTKPLSKWQQYAADLTSQVDALGKR